MKKALHILKIVLKDTVMPREKEYVNEAIKELEDLQNRTCKNCKYVFSDTLGFIYCSSPKSPLSSCVFPIHPNFCCNKWEVKNECS